MHLGIQCSQGSGEKKAVPWPGRRRQRDQPCSVTSYLPYGNLFVTQFSDRFLWESSRPLVTLGDSYRCRDRAPGADDVSGGNLRLTAASHASVF